jgi:nucleotide-binding universal stress UspA family protein
MRRILMTTDGSNHALTGAHYLGQLFAGTAEIEICILNVSPKTPPLFLEESHNPRVRRQFEAWRDRIEREAKEYLHEAAQVLHKAGLKEHQIQTRHLRQRVGVARDIIQEADAEGCDAVVLGKKGMNWLEEYFLGSITTKLLEISENHPVWVVDGRDFDPKRILIAMDETEYAVSVAQYVGTMLKGVSGLEVFLYHFCPSGIQNLDSTEAQELQEAGEHWLERKMEIIEGFFKEAKQVLEKSGIPGRHIYTQFFCDISHPDKKISQGILDEVKAEKIGTLVLGRKGSSRAREFRLGSVALRTVSAAENCAVWVV